MDLDNTPQSDQHYILPGGHGQPVEPPRQNNDHDQAANLVRQKIAAIYGDNTEPDAKVEIQEVNQPDLPRSKHQEFMYKLSTSGKSLAEIQTDWHNYYTGLPDKEKHEVWQEFYTAHGQGAHYGQPATAPSNTPPATPQTIHAPAKPVVGQIAPPDPNSGTVADLKKQITRQVRSRGRLKAKHHFHSLLFGLGMGSLVVLIMLFGFFNERFIAPFITPSRSVSATPIITDPNSTAAGPNPEIIIPKINVEIPVVYDEPSIDENAVETALQRGVVHYATTPNPGELGNAVIFGHSSNNILNPGKYKFAFVLLSRLENGDLFYLDKDGKRYVYQVYKKSIVDPSQVSVINTQDKPATATLITCDPPGTSIHRLVVVGMQISPDPLNDKTSSVSGNQPKPVVLPSNSPSLWSRIVHWF